MADLIDREQAINTVLGYLAEYCGAAFDEDMQKGLETKLNRLPSMDGKMIKKNCRSCPHMDFNENSDEMYCRLMDCEQIHLRRYKRRPDWCPFETGIAARLIF